MSLAALTALKKYPRVHDYTGGVFMPREIRGATQSALVGAFPPLSWTNLSPPFSNRTIRISVIGQRHRVLWSSGTGANDGYGSKAPFTTGVFFSLFSGPALPSIGWSRRIGIGGCGTSKSLAAFHRNQWPLRFGITGRHLSECAGNFS